jgi:hypothetical protein
VALSQPVNANNATTVVLLISLYFPGVKKGLPDNQRAAG